MTVSKQRRSKKGFTWEENDELFVERDQLRLELWNQVLRHGKARALLFERMFGEVPEEYRVAVGMRPGRARDCDLAAALNAASQTPANALLREVLSDPDLRPPVREDIETALAAVECVHRRIEEGNLPLVIAYANKAKWSPLDVSDLVQEAYFGLRRAVECFDRTMGNRFATYAVWWIRQSIVRSSRNEGTIREPCHLYDARSRVRAALKDGVAEADLAAVTRLTKTRLQSALEVPPRVASTEWPVCGSDGGEPVTLGQLLPSDLDVERETERAQALDRLSDVVESLDARSAYVVRERFRGQGLREIGEELGISRERVRQIEKRAHDIIGARINGRPTPKKPRVSRGRFSQSALALKRIGECARKILTDRELFVLKGRAGGLTHPEIAQIGGEAPDKTRRVERVALAKIRTHLKRHKRDCLPLEPSGRAQAPPRRAESAGAGHAC